LLEGDEMAEEKKMIEVSEKQLVDLILNETRVVDMTERVLRTIARGREEILVRALIECLADDLMNKGWFEEEYLGG